MSLLAVVSAARRRLRSRARARVLLAPLALVLLVPGTASIPLLLLLGPRLRASTPTAAAPVLAERSADGSTIEPVTTPELDPIAQLLRALDEAHRNCDVARALARGQLPPAGAPLFRTAELETALLENPWVADRALGEADTLLEEAAWLAALDPHATLGGRSWEDVRYLLGGIHWYLERAWDAAARSEVARRAHPGLAGALAGAPLPAPARHDQAPDAYDRRSLREYHDLPTFEDLLGRWD